MSTLRRINLLVFGVLAFIANWWIVIVTRDQAFQPWILGALHLGGIGLFGALLAIAGESGAIASQIWGTIVGLIAPLYEGWAGVALNGVFALLLWFAGWYTYECRIQLPELKEMPYLKVTLVDDKGEEHEDITDSLSDGRMYTLKRAQLATRKWVRIYDSYNILDFDSSAHRDKPMDVEGERLFGPLDYMFANEIDPISLSTGFQDLRRRLKLSIHNPNDGKDASVELYSPDCNDEIRKNIIPVELLTQISQRLGASRSESSSGIEASLSEISPDAVDEVQIDLTKDKPIEIDGVIYNVVYCDLRDGSFQLNITADSNVYLTQERQSIDTPTLRNLIEFNGTEAYGDLAKEFKKFYSRDYETFWDIFTKMLSDELNFPARYSPSDGGIRSAVKLFAVEGARDRRDEWLSGRKIEFPKSDWFFSRLVDPEVMRRNELLSELLAIAPGVRDQKYGLNLFKSMASLLSESRDDEDLLDVMWSQITSTDYDQFKCLCYGNPEVSSQFLRLLADEPTPPVDGLTKLQNLLKDLKEMQQRTASTVGSARYP
jgi:hypothetical protein